MKNERTSKIAGKIKKLREARGWTQVELAKRIGVTAETTSQYEKKGFPRFQNLEKLARVFDVTIEYFYPKKKRENHSVPLDSLAKFRKHFLNSSKRDQKKIIQFLLSYNSKTKLVPGRP